jgi:cardiolipin synthase
MTLANKITVLRIIAIPLFVIALWEHYILCARIIFVLSVASDALDGIVARIRGERTPLGTFLDPLADKLLLLATFVAFTALGSIPVWVFITVLSRDMLIVLGWSVVYILTGNRKIEPRFLGKITTALQMAVAVGKLFDFPLWLYHLGLHVMVACTILSACDYVWLGNKRLGPLE